MALKANGATSRQDPLTRAKGRGSSRSGTDHWLSQQYASVALILLGLYAFASFFGAVVLKGGYDNARDWIAFPPTALFMILLVSTAAYHGANGLLGIVEDYVHHPAANLLLVLLVKSLAMLTAASGILAILKIFLGA